jgi:hypothetical protein
VVAIALTVQADLIASIAAREWAKPISGQVIGITSRSHRRMDGLQSV